MRAALRPYHRGSQQRIRHNLRAAAGEIRKESRYRVVSSHRASQTSGSLESEYSPENSEAAGDSGFQLLDLLHEEVDSEAVSTDSSKVSITTWVLGVSGQQYQKSVSETRT